MLFIKILCFNGAVSRSRNLFSSGRLLLDCQLCLPVDIMPKFMINSQPPVTRYPTSFDQNPENSGESAFCSNPISTCVYLQANHLRDIFQRFGFSFAMRNEQQVQLHGSLMPTRSLSSYSAGSNVHWIKMLKSCACRTIGSGAVLTELYTHAEHLQKTIEVKTRGYGNYGNRLFQLMPSLLQKVFLRPT